MIAAILEDLENRWFRCPCGATEAKVEGGGCSSCGGVVVRDEGCLPGQVAS